MWDMGWTKLFPLDAEITFEYYLSSLFLNKIFLKLSFLLLNYLFWSNTRISYVRLKSPHEFNADHYHSFNIKGLAIYNGRASIWKLSSINISSSEALRSPKINSYLHSHTLYLWFSSLQQYDSHRIYDFALITWNFTWKLLLFSF